MKKIPIICIIMLILFPLNVLANEHLTIKCEKKKIYIGEEVECKINISNLNYTVTSITGKINVSDNLKIIDSSYDDKNWLMLDKNFSVKDINLISENKDYRKNFTIGTFKIKAINKENEIGNILFKDVYIGDDNYEDHKQIDAKVTLQLKYDKKNSFNMDYKLIIYISLLGFIMLIVVKLKNK